MVVARVSASSWVQHSHVVFQLPIVVVVCPVLLHYHAHCVAASSVWGQVVRTSWQRADVLGASESRGRSRAHGGGDGLLARGVDEGWSSCEASWLGADRFPFVSFFLFSVWRGWGAWCLDALLAPDIRMLAIL